MPRWIQIASHLSVEELEQRYRQAQDGVESRHCQIIWLLAQGKRIEEVSEVTGYSRSWIYEWRSHPRVDELLLVGRDG